MRAVQLVVTLVSLGGAWANDDIEPDEIIFDGMKDIFDAFSKSHNVSDDLKKQFAENQEKLKHAYAKQKSEKVSQERAKRYEDGIQAAGSLIKDGGDAVKKAIDSGSATDWANAAITIIGGIMTTISAFSEAAGPFGAAVSCILNVVQVVMGVCQPPPYGRTETPLTDVVTRAIDHALNEQAFKDTQFDYMGYFNQFKTCLIVLDEVHPRTARETRDVLDAAGLTQILVQQDVFLGGIEAKIQDAVQRSDPTHIVAYLQTYFQTSSHLSLLIARAASLLSLAATDRHDDLTGWLSLFKIRGDILMSNLRNVMEKYLKGPGGLKDMQYYLFATPQGSTTGRTQAKLWNIKYDSVGLAKTCDEGCGGWGPYYPFATLGRIPVFIDVVLADMSQQNSQSFIFTGDWVCLVNSNTSYTDEHKMMMYYDHWNWSPMYDDLKTGEDIQDRHQWQFRNSSGSNHRPLSDGMHVTIHHKEYNDYMFAVTDRKGDTESMKKCQSELYGKVTNDDLSSSWRLEVSRNQELGVAVDELEAHAIAFKNYPPTPAPAPSTSELVV